MMITCKGRANGRNGYVIVVDGWLFFLPRVLWANDDMLGLELGSDADVSSAKTDRRDGIMLQVASFVALFKKRE